MCVCEFIDKCVCERRTIRRIDQGLRKGRKFTVCLCERNLNNHLEYLKKIQNTK